MQTPLVSIIIPVYNGADYVKQAIDSALAQTYDNIEIIVVNDGSNDGGKTDAICKSYGDSIRYILKENGGVSSALNLGIESMRGDYFSWLSHDDLYTPDKIRESVNALNTLTNVDKTIVICGTEYIDSNGDEISLIQRSIPQCATGIQMFEYCFLKKNALNGSALLISKRAFEECGKFSGLKFSQDMEMWGRMMIAGYNFLHCPNKGSLIRVHKNQATNQLRNVFFEERPKFLLSLFEETLKIETDRSEFQKQLLKVCYSTYPQPKELINRIEAHVNISTFDIVKHSCFGWIIQNLKNIYHIIKFRNK